MKTTNIFQEFFQNEKSSGLLLIVCTLVSLILANSFIAHQYLEFWHLNFANHPLEYWINDGLMTLFFLLIGLELEREIYNGELSNIKSALLPFSAAIGGMLLPAGLFLLLNLGTKTQSGFGIPMATDIAFAIGILSLLGKRIPTSLKVFLTALAVIDDLGAILIIAVFYTKSLIWSNLVVSLLIFTALLILNRLKVRSLLIYLIGGVFMWYFMLNSGVHATITGVLLAFAIPFENGDEKSISIQLQRILHKPVSFIILPLFALVNTAIVLNSNWKENLTATYTLGIALGLIVGKPIGIFLFSYVATKLKICTIPEDMNWKSLFGVALLGGIGFTMSIFITILAFNDMEHITNSKIMILLSSLITGTVGFLFLKSILKKEIIED